VAVFESVLLSLGLMVIGLAFLFLILILFVRWDRRTSKDRRDG
jgi:Na+-transporting methylmalonyl-CoA/oxaloacetate decarboxylase gamma subunit